MARTHEGHTSGITYRYDGDPGGTVDFHYSMRFLGSPTPVRVQIPVEDLIAIVADIKRTLQITRLEDMDDGEVLGL